ncbi:DUF2155 domain-containing protein [Asaia spathodeae]|uniref:DUF2155 domain-containing protein n=1 Tax=Asaia spathodeae TaxID=657016 RepID=UPI002FC3AC37
MKRALSRTAMLVALPLAMAPGAIIPAALAAEAVAPPVMYPADLWQGRGEAVIRVLNRTDSHIETLTIPVGGQAQYRSLHLGVTRCVDRPETLPSDSAALITTSDDTNPGGHYEGWILAEEPSLTGYKSALYGITVISCSGPKTDPALAPLPQSVVPVLTNATPEGAQNQPGDLDDPTHAAASGGAPPQTLPNAPPGSLPARPPATQSGGPMALTPFGEQTAPSRPPVSAPRQMTGQPQHQDAGGPMQLAPLSGGSTSGGSGQALPPPQPYNQ